jgi:hypothetical protein
MDPQRNSSSVRFLPYRTIYELLTCFLVTSVPLRLLEYDFDHINEIFDELGPVPHLCIAYDKDELRTYRQDLTKALGHLTIDNLQKATTGREGLNTDAISHKLCLIRRLERTSIRFSKKVKISPITPFVGLRIAFQLRNADRHELMALYKQYVALPATRKMSGNLFEAYCQQLFCETISIKFVPMVHIGDSEVSKNKCQPHWHTTNMKLSPRLLENKRWAALRKRMSLDISHRTSIKFISPKLYEKLKIKLMSTTRRQFLTK